MTDCYVAKDAWGNGVIRLTDWLGNGATLALFCRCTSEAFLALRVVHDDRQQSIIVSRDMARKLSARLKDFADTGNLTADEGGGQ